MATKYTKWTENIPRKCTKWSQNIPLHDPPKFIQIVIFWFENKPSGNPASETPLQGISAALTFVRPLKRK
jgi:hypothetical protein